MLIIVVYMLSYNRYIISLVANLSNFAFLNFDKLFSFLSYNRPWQWWLRIQRRCSTDGPPRQNSCRCRCAGTRADHFSKSDECAWYRQSKVNQARSSRHALFNSWNCERPADAGEKAAKSTWSDPGPTWAYAKPAGKLPWSGQVHGFQDQPPSSRWGPRCTVSTRQSSKFTFYLNANNNPKHPSRPIQSPWSAAFQTCHQQLASCWNANLEPSNRPTLRNIVGARQLSSGWKRKDGLAHSRIQVNDLGGPAEEAAGNRWWQGTVALPEPSQERDPQGRTGNKNMMGNSRSNDNKKCKIPQFDREILQSIFQKVRMQFPGFQDWYTDNKCKTVEDSRR